jgi:hypothetical protein
VANRGEGAECDNLRRCDLSAEGKAITVCRDWALWATAVHGITLSFFPPHPKLWLDLVVSPFLELAYSSCIVQLGVLLSFGPLVLWLFSDIVQPLSLKEA